MNSTTVTGSVAHENVLSSVFEGAATADAGAFLMLALAWVGKLLVAGVLTFERGVALVLPFGRPLNLATGVALRPR